VNDLINFLMILSEYYPKIGVFSLQKLSEFWH
jgi:hypothetical protein